MDNVLQLVNQYQLQNILLQMLNEAAWHRKQGTFAQFEINFSKTIRNVPKDYKDTFEINMVKHDLNSITLTASLVRFNYSKKKKMNLIVYDTVMDYNDILELLDEFE